MSVEKALFGNSTYQLLRGALDTAALRQKVIADNVANADTPGFKAHEVAFEEFLGNAMGNGGGQLKMTAPEGGSAIPIGGLGNGVPRPQVMESPAPDANSGSKPGDFDMEKAMTQLSENKVQYATVAQLLSNRLIALRNAIESK